MLALATAKAEGLREKAAQATQERDFASALTHLSAAIYLCPDDPRLLTLRGDCYAKSLDFHSAIVNYRRALKLVKESSAQSDEGVGEGGSGSSGEGGVDAEQMQRRLAQLLDTRALNLMDNRDQKGALLLFSEAILLNKSDPSIWLHRALGHTALEQFDLARSDLVNAKPRSCGHSSRLALPFSASLPSPNNLAVPTPTSRHTSGLPSIWTSGAVRQSGPEPG